MKFTASITKNAHFQVQDVSGFVAMHRWTIFAVVLIPLFVFVLSFFLRQKMGSFLLSFACLISLNSGLGFVYRFPNICHYSFFSQRTTALKKTMENDQMTSPCIARERLFQVTANDGWTFGTKTNLTLIGNTKDMCMTMQRL